MTWKTFTNIVLQALFLKKKLACASKLAAHKTKMALYRTFPTLSGNDHNFLIHSQSQQKLDEKTASPTFFFLSEYFEMDSERNGKLFNKSAHSYSRTLPDSLKDSHIFVFLKACLLLGNSSAEMEQQQRWRLPPVSPKMKAAGAIGSEYSAHTLANTMNEQRCVPCSTWVHLEIHFFLLKQSNCQKTFEKATFKLDF